MTFAEAVVKNLANIQILLLSEWDRSMRSVRKRMHPCMQRKQCHIHGWGESRLAFNGFNNMPCG